MVVASQAQVALLSQEQAPSKPSDPVEESFRVLRDRAWKTVVDAVKIASKIKDTALRAAALYQRALVLSWKFRGQEALVSATDAEALFRDLGLEQGEVHAMILRAEMLNATGDKEAGLETIEAAIELAKKLEDPVAEDAAASAHERIKGKAAAPQMTPEMLALMQMQAGDGGGAQQSTEVAVASAAAPAKPKGLNPAMVAKKVMETIKNSLTADEDEIGSDSALMEAGMDSLSSVELMTTLSREFQMNFAPSLVFDFPTGRALTDHIVEQSMEMA